MNNQTKQNLTNDCSHCGCGDSHKCGSGKKSSSAKDATPC